MPSESKSKSRSKSSIQAKRRPGRPLKYTPCKGQEIRDPQTHKCRAKKLPGRPPGPKMNKKSKSKSKSGSISSSKSLSPDFEPSRSPDRFSRKYISKLLKKSDRRGTDEIMNTLTDNYNANELLNPDDEFGMTEIGDLLDDKKEAGFPYDTRDLNYKVFLKWNKQCIENLNSEEFAYVLAICRAINLEKPQNVSLKTKRFNWAWDSSNTFDGFNDYVASIFFDAHKELVILEPK